MTMAASSCQCSSTAAFCKPVFDPGGISPPEKLPSYLLTRQEVSVSFAVNFQAPRIQPAGCGLGSDDQVLCKKFVEARSSSDSHDDILTLLDNGRFEQALHILLVMYAQDVVPHQDIFAFYLKACRRRNALFPTKQLHAHLVLHGLDFVSSLVDYLLSTLFKCGGFQFAVQVFQMLPRRTVFSWKAIITGHIDCGLEQDAMELYEMMLEDNVEPDKYIYASLIRACADLLDLHQGKVLHVDAQERSLHVDAFVGSALIHMYGKCNSSVEAETVFEHLWLRDAVSWNAMLSVYVEQGDARKALQCYRKMQEEGLRPNNKTFAAALLACSILGENEETVGMCLAIGEALHSDARRMGFDSDTILCNNLMSMYGKCGSIAKFQNVFNKMSQRSVVSWMVMLKAYLEHGQAETTLQLYRQMQEEGIRPDERVLMVSLQACCLLAREEEPVFVEGQWSRVMSLTIGKALHSDAKSNSSESDVFVISNLMGMYGICGRIQEAEKVFSDLSQRDLVSYNAMLSVYVEQGKGAIALRLYRQMKEEGIQSDIRTIAIALQACCILAEEDLTVAVQNRSIKLMCLDIGRSLHCDALRNDFCLDLFFSYNLLSMYRRCGSFEEAKQVASGPVVRGNMYWIEVLSLCVEEGESEKALQLFRCMQAEGIRPNRWAFVLAIRACCLFAERRDASVGRESAMSMASLIGEALHADAWRQGFSSDVFVGSALLTLYSMCGDLVEAESVFAALAYPDIASWNAMLWAYLEQGHGEKVLQLYRNSQNDRVCQTEVTFVATLQACCMLAEKEGAGLDSGESTQVSLLRIGKALHADARKMGLDSFALVCSALVTMYSICGSIADAESTFAGPVQHDIVSWTAMLSVYIEQGKAEKALQLFTHIQKAGITPDAITFVSVLEACAKLAENEEPVKASCLKIARALHADCLSLGYDWHDAVQSNLINVYGKCKNLVDAETAFNTRPERSTRLWNTMLSTYVDLGQGEKALHLYKLYQDVGVLMDDFTLVCVLQACSLTANIEICRQVHNLIECLGPDCHDNLRNILTHAYGSCASITDCQAMFDSISQPDVVSWNALLSGYVRQGEDEASLQAFDKMQQAGLISNRVTALLLLSVYSHAGKVDGGFEFLESLSQKHGVTPNAEHYESMLNSLGRAGDFSTVEDVMSKEATHVSSSIWLSLLGACQIHGNLELGSWAWSLHMKPKQAKAYITMANIHART